MKTIVDRFHNKSDIVVIILKKTKNNNNYKKKENIRNDRNNK